MAANLTAVVFCPFSSPLGLGLDGLQTVHLGLAILTRNLHVYRIGFQQRGPSGEALGQYSDERCGNNNAVGDGLCVCVRCCHLLQKPWMVWGSAAAVALTAVTVAVLYRT